ncbi:MAG: hypothetical protein KBT19_05855 [Lachnospiraceae bacterium]|nr:hypothetical protein [Candidatus Colinaster equi]
MKYNFECYGLYMISKMVTNAIRSKVVMKEEIDIDVMRHAINVAMKRYPYFKKQLTIDETGAYVLEPNDQDVVVLKTRKKMPDLCSEEVNRHLLYVDCERNICYFNFSHTLAGGKGILPWIQTCIYQYVVEKYEFVPNAECIRKPDSELLPGENTEPTLELAQDAIELSRDKCRNAFVPIKDYLSSALNPFKRSHEYFTFTFDAKELVGMSTVTDNSVNSIICVLMLKALDKVIPAKCDKITAQIPHNPASALGIPNNRNNVLSYVFIPFKRNVARKTLEQLGTITRGAIFLQTDSAYSRNDVKRTMEYWNGIDSVTGYKEKLTYAKQHDLLQGRQALHASYVVSYTGFTDWGELIDYVESYCFIVDGHQTLELSAIGDKIICNYMQVIRTDKYVDAFKKTLEENGIPYKVEGPFKKNLPIHRLE